jgi:glutaredoxin
LFLFSVISFALDNNIPLVVIELDQRQDGPRLQAALELKTGQTTVPNVFLEGEHIGGWTEVEAALAAGAFEHVTVEGALEKAAAFGVECRNGDPYVLFPEQPQEL